MKKKTLSNKEIRELNEGIKKYNFQFDKKDRVEIAEDEKYRVIKSNNETLFFYSGENIFPSLKLLLKNNNLKKIAVDMGAIKFVASGADVMRPGIVDIDEGISKDEVISIVDINNKKPIAIGKSLFDTNQMKELKTGKAILNLHFIGDEIWKS